MVERVARAIAASDGDDYLEHRAEFEGYARAAIEAMMDPMIQWQPIETAPRDGKTTILMGKWHDGEHYWIASGCIEGDQYWCDFTDDDFPPFSHQNPTHWAPIPKQSWNT